ncbi:P1 family peptidase [Hoeflea prorocentri]|uniref:P1 family peptidase n=1 Tax=Hoeflea prorocentri TaxID=1922333 RepID=A0A9X3UH56_9HYPH|nr:P1 family peptidase [Hoeflea prorocentri]MCY6380375.1 P1 family peptidase [Hoeflea prorocentri]MDA5398175.1 P1 family peptidase [Hoeflea prorocentri]
MMKTGKRNLITDVGGLTVGNAQDSRLKSGVTAVLCKDNTVASVQVLGGAPGTRETDLLEPHNTVGAVNGIILSGGSAFGLDAASGVQAALRKKRVGFEIGPHVIPIVPSAILFDLVNGGDKDWGLYPPYRELGFEAANSAAQDFETGTAGAGAGATTAELKGGLGSASTIMDNGVTVGALVAVNAVGTANVAGGPHFWAAPFEIGNEFGGLGLPSPLPESTTDLRIKFREPESPEGRNTTIAVIATDAVLSKAEAKRLAISSHDGFARAIWPAHTAYDGDLIFSLATGTSGKTLDVDAFIDLCAVAASTMSRAIARGVYEATPEADDVLPTWQSVHGNDI